MRKTILLLGLLGLNFAFGQNANCDKLKVENNTLKTANTSLNEENIYLKKVLDINKALKEVSADDFDFKITKVEGNLKTKEVFITILSENKIENRNFSPRTVEIVDIEGNIPKINYEKLVNFHVELAKNVPTKSVYVFKYDNFDNEPPRIIKIFKLAYEHNLEFKIGNFGQIEMKDLNINWK
jgi:transposase